MSDESNGSLLATHDSSLITCFMIPLRDTNRSGTVPVVTIVFIILNGVVFLYELSLGMQLTRFFYVFGVVPSFYFSSQYWQTAGLLIGILPLFTSMFLHGGWLHFLFNMLYLWVFGDNVEDRLGHWRFFFFYFICGFAAALLHIVTNPSSKLPTIGASGSIAGVLGAYLVLFPGARVLTLVPIVFFFQLIELPAILFLGFWFVMQFLSGAMSLTSGDVGGTAWWAHIGGFFAGVLLIWRYRNRARRRVYYE
jgi:membrane associated rhomboid family serine protease